MIARRSSEFRRALGFSVAALVAFSAQQARAADPDETPISRRCRLCSRLAPEVTIGMPLWVPVVIGTFGYESGAPPAQIDSSLRFAFVGRLGVRAWGLSLQAESFGVGFNSRTAHHEAQSPELDSFALISRGVVAYHLPVIRFAPSSRSALLGFVPYGGARLQRVNASFPATEATAAQEQALSWLYGIAGLAIDLDFRVGLTLHLELDGGGFKPDSDMAWWAAIKSEYALTSWLGLSAGWNFYRLRHQTDAVDLRVRLNGPELALSFYLH
jgi:hypothetical protein